jgi:hypothetical protein
MTTSLPFRFVGLVLVAGAGISHRPGFVQPAHGGEMALYAFARFVVLLKDIANQITALGLSWAGPVGPKGGADASVLCIKYLNLQDKSRLT